MENIKGNISVIELESWGISRAYWRKNTNSWKHL